MVTDISEIYDTMWSRQFESLSKECINREEQVMSTTVGGCHSTVLTNRGRLFAWGWNDKYQLTGAAGSTKGQRPKEVMKDKRVVYVACADDHTLALDNTGTIWTFGDNLKG
jgi:alpha-tubulin suppressor-like RCC1 family protein